MVQQQYSPHGRQFRRGQVAPETGSGVSHDTVLPKACSYRHQFARWSLEERNLSLDETDCIPCPRKLPVCLKVCQRLREVLFQESVTHLGYSFAGKNLELGTN